MKYIISTTDETAKNMALEAWLFENREDLDEVFYLWINRPSIIIGRNQNSWGEINEDYVREHKIGVYRRISGGGAVYHDHQNLNYTIISNGTTIGNFDFKQFSQPVIRALRKMGIEAECTGRNDISIGGRKICGNAQARRGTRVLHHGCILFDVDLGVLGNALKVDPAKVASKSVKSVRARVCNIASEMAEPITIEAFRQLIFDEMRESRPGMEALTLSEEDEREIQKIADERFSNPDWNWGHCPDFEMERRGRFPAGGLEVRLKVEDQRIKGIKIYGDFFSSREIAELETALIGCPYRFEAIRDCIASQKGESFFNGISAEEAASVIAPAQD